MKRMFAIAAATALLALSLVGGAAQPAQADTASLKTYVVVFKGDYALDGSFVMDATYALGPGYALGNNYALVQEYALKIIDAAGGAVTNDLSKQIGVMIVQSASETFAETMRSYALVDEVAEDFKWKAFSTYEEALAGGGITPLDASAVPGGGPDQTQDVLEPLQWNMANISAAQAHDVQAGSRLVEVGILDSGIDATHVDFIDTDGSNVDCLVKGRDFVTAGPGVGSPVSCTDNQFHGTHVAGIVAARANGAGVVGVAPNVTLVPVKVCDTSGYCYSSSTVAGITYAGDAKLEVVNMSFFVDDDALLESTELKCASDPVQRAFRKANERALKYARGQGVVLVAALGNSDTDLAASDDCNVVPAEAPGVIGTTALGPENEKAYYSSYGSGAADVAAPGGNPEFLEELCVDEVLSTVPGNQWACFSGTSMASPHAAGVAALIVSQFGKVDSSGDVVMAPGKVEDYLAATVIDQGLVGYDECFGNGRINALRAVRHDTSKSRDGSAPNCPEYGE